MKFNYGVLNNITNPDFQTCRAQLLRYCKEIERKCNVGKSGELRDCCRIARVANEVLLRHLYKRLLSSGEEPTAGAILQNPEFAQKIGDIELIVASEKVQKTGNQYSHDKAYNNESQAQYENRMSLEDAKLPLIVDDLLETLATVLECAVPIINGIPSSRKNIPKPGTTANVQSAASNAVPVKVEGPPRGRLRLEKAKNYNGTGVKLIATLADADFKLEDSDVSIEWGFIGGSGNYIPITGENSRKATDIKCSIGKGALEKRYHCIVRRQGFSKPLKAIFRPFTEDDFAIRGTVEIRFDAEENALKAIVKNPNFEGQAQYTWYRNGVVQNGQRERFLKVSRKDIGATYTCEITHPEVTFSKKSETPYTITKEDFKQAAASPQHKKPKAKAIWLVLSCCIVIAIAVGFFFLRQPEETTSSLPGWGPERPTYTNAEPADHATFNSLEDNPVFGDERDFVRIVEKDAGQTYSSDITIEPGKQYEVIIMYHNNASSTLNDEAHDYVGMAYNAKVMSNFSTELAKGETGYVTGMITADGTDPESVWDSAHITASDDLTLHYVTGSAILHNNWDANGMTMSTAMFSEDGDYLGVNELNGVIPGCYEYSGFITYTIQTYAAGEYEAGAATTSIWGPERPTYTNEKPADHATFNSITDNAAVGDERDFVRIEEKSSGRPYSSDVTIEAGRQYEVYIYYHNNASSTYNDEAHDYAGVARDVRLAASFPSELSAGETGIVSATISASNTDPVAVWDGAYITAKEDVTLSYVEGTAKIYNDWDVNGSVLSTNLFSDEGTFLGLNELNGIVLGCDEYSGAVVYTIQVSAAE